LIVLHYYNYFVRELVRGWLFDKLLKKYKNQPANMLIRGKIPKRYYKIIRRIFTIGLAF